MNYGAASLRRDPGTPLRVALAAAVVSGLLCAGCGGSSSSGDNGAGDSGVPDPFIAQVSDFAGFCKDWSSAPALAPADAGGDGIHGDAGLTVYWNKSPPHGATQFPVGTIILKETNDADPSKRTAFAMVKRTARGRASTAPPAAGPTAGSGGR